jgi:Fungal Zn(2)-Cys(6) binuclear cluster domain
MSAEESASPDASNAARQAACLACRKSKIKCIRNPDSTVCKKCTSSGGECVIPEYHVGRYKGVKKFVLYLENERLTD